MFDDQKNDTFLSRWLTNELTEEELTVFREKPEYNEYLKIIAGTEQLKSQDDDTEQMLARTKLATSKKTVKKIYLRKLWGYGVAASIALLIGVFAFNFNTVSVKSDFGQQLAYTLPDGSEVLLNAKSKLEYNKKNWHEERELTLNGEAFFKVKKGSVFTVKTNRGSVKVLGTQFNVHQVNDLLDVTCYEGKVKVITAIKTQTLTQGKGFRVLQKKVSNSANIKEETPGWTRQESTFKSVPLKYVLLALEKQFDIKFKNDLLNKDIIFSGSFPHSNKKIALKTVLGTLNINYTFSGKNTVILVK